MRAAPPAIAPALLQMRGVWVEYGNRVVIERLSLDIVAGSFVSIVGPSGAGKSSLLRLILGQEAPSRGQILLDGRPLAAECGPDRGVVFQRYSVFPHLSALANVMLARDFSARLWARLWGAARRSAQEEAMAMLGAVGLADAARLYPAQMSGGMQQRLAIAQALIMRPRILLLDEPFGALDPGIRADMHALIRALWQRHGLTIVMVTHDIREAFTLGTRVIALDKRRHDPHAPHRFGAVATYDLVLRPKDAAHTGDAAAAASAGRGA